MEVTGANSSGSGRIGPAASLAVCGVILVAILATLRAQPVHAQLKSGPWPMFQHDLKHTGLSRFDSSANSGALRWKFNVGVSAEWVFGASPAIGLDGTIYAGSVDGLYAVNPDGSLKWKFPTGGPVFSSPAIGADGTIYVGSGDDNLYAINSDGSLKWRFATADSVLSSPAIGPDGTIYIGSDDYNLYAINPGGSQKWKFITGGEIESSPAIGPGGTIYVGSRDDNLYAINPDGSQKWTFAVNVQQASAAVGAGGIIFFPSHDDSLYAIKPDGRRKWKFATDSPLNGSPAIGADGTVYVGSEGGYLYAIAPDGHRKWRFASGASLHSSPAIGADGTIYTGSIGPNFYAIRPDGRLKWRFAAGLWSGSPAIGADGTIYVYLADGNLYALGGSGKLAMPATVSFGNVGTGTGPARRMLTIKNTSSTKLCGMVNASGLKAPFSVPSPTIRPFSLPRNQTMSLPILFRPTMPQPTDLQSFADTISILSSDPDHPSASMTINGNGVTGQLVVPSALNFGAVPHGKRKSVTLLIRNGGPGVLHVVVDSPGVGTPFFATPQKFTLRYNGSKALSVRFAPPGAGFFGGTIRITSDQPSRPSVFVTLTGTGL